MAEDRIYYLTPEPPSIADAAHILRAAVDHYRWLEAGVAEEDDDRALALHRVLKLADGLAREPNLEAAAASAADAARRLAGAERATVLFYDLLTETLWNRWRPSARAQRCSGIAV